MIGLANGKLNERKKIDEDIGVRYQSFIGYIQTVEATKDDKKIKHSPLFTQGAPVEERTRLTMCRSIRELKFPLDTSN